MKSRPSSFVVLCGKNMPVLAYARHHRPRACRHLTLVLGPMTGSERDAHSSGSLPDLLYTCFDWHGFGRTGALPASHTRISGRCVSTPPDDCLTVTSHLCLQSLEESSRSSPRLSSTAGWLGGCRNHRAPPGCRSSSLRNEKNKARVTGLRAGRASQHSVQNTEFDFKN